MNTSLHMTLPPEWYPQSGVQLTWPHDQTDWKPYLVDIEYTMVELANIITQHEKLLVATPHPEEVQRVLSLRLSAEQMARVRCCSVATDDTWARDHAALTLLDAEGRGEAQLLDFRFNGWGEKFAASQDNLITQRLFAQGVFHAHLVDYTDFVLEGGAVEVDEEGTLFTTAHCLLAPHRNQPLTEEQIVAQLKERLGVKRVVCLHHGRLEGDDTDGHIDTLVRPAPQSTLLYVQCSDTQDSHYEELKAMEDELKTLRTLGGDPYRLLPLPHPHPVLDGEERLPATYANFLIINRAVIMPTYAQPDLDEQARCTLQQAFPEREIVGVDARTVVRQHGSLHCLTMQYPEGVLKG